MDFSFFSHDTTSSNFDIFLLEGRYEDKIELNTTSLSGFFFLFVPVEEGSLGSEFSTIKSIFVGV
jgi:hypothetical protein